MKRFLIMVVSILMLLFTFGCDNTTTTESTIITTNAYDLYSQHYLTDASMQLSQNYDTYYLYYYQLECGGCNAIKEEVLAKLELLENDVLFLVLVTSYDDINDNIAVEYTPSLVRVVNHQVDEIAVGPTNVLTMIETLS